MKGHENKKKITPFQSHIMGENGERLREKKMHAIRGSKDLYSRILGGIGKGSEDQPQLQYFNLAMENVLKGLPDKISFPYIIHKCTSNVHIFLITFKLRDRGDEIGSCIHKNDAELFFNV